MRPVKSKQFTHDNQSKTRKRGIFIYLLIILLIPVVGGLWAKNIYESRISAPLSNLTEKQNFEIESGSSTEQIADLLVEEDLVPANMRFFFKLYLKLNNLDGTIQAGTFSVPKDLNIKQLIKTLQTAGIPEVWVSLPEGLRKDEIANIIKSEFSGQNVDFDHETFLNLTTDPEFIATLDLTSEVDDLEGFLYPSKYLIPLEYSESEILTTLITTFTDRYEDVTYEQLIIASMLEREGRNDTERAMIADIINRRYFEGWFLNIDATLLYELGDWSHVITIEDLERDNPYNTYTRIGLPPTPICNPGESSINAVLNPTPNNYYYYLHDNNGNIHYATTSSEHGQNVNTYLR